MTIFGFFGDVGSYKTSLMTAFLREGSLMGLDSWTNYLVDFENNHEVDLSGLLSLGRVSGLMGIDEIYTVAESRVSSSKLNRFFSYFIFQSRKIGGDEGLDVLYTAQLSSSVDKRLFDLTDVKFACFGENDEGDIEFAYVVGQDGDIEEIVIPKEFFEVEIWGHYDTYQKVNPLGIEDLIVEVERFDCDKINSRIDGYVKRIRDTGINIKFKYQLEDCMLRLGIPQSVSKFVWNRLQSESRLLV